MFDEKEYESYVHHILDFVEIPSSVTLISGRSIEPLYFVLVKEKGITEELLKKASIFNHVNNIGDMFFIGNCFKLVTSRNCNMKQFQVIVREVLLPTGEINDINVDINDDLQKIVNIYNGLIHKTYLWIALFCFGRDRNEIHF